VSRRLLLSRQGIYKRKSICIEPYILADSILCTGSEYIWFLRFAIINGIRRRTKCREEVESENE
jgi:hypothetical protein